MPKDSGLTDNCFYLLANDQDTGDREKLPPPLWHAPEVVIYEPGDVNITPVGDNEIKASHKYNWRVSVHRKGGAACQTPPANGVRVELWVSPASTAPILSACKLIGNFLHKNLPDPGFSNWADSSNDFVNDQSWTPSNDVTKPDGPGYRCLVARCYPEDGQNKPDANGFHYPDDPHVAQRNIFVNEVAAGSQSASFEFASAMTRVARTPEAATIKAVADLAPSRLVLNSLRPLLERRRGYKRVATAAPRRFGLELPDFDAPVIDDETRASWWRTLFGRNHQPEFKARVKLSPEKIYRSHVTADLSRSQPGDAHVFHVSQAGADGRVQGGLTLVVLAV